MKIADIKQVAIEKGVKAGKLTKVELVRAIQVAEGNNDCFGHGHAATCGQDSCLWRQDCD